MKTINVVMVRIYLTESSHLLKSVVSYLKNEAKVRGVSVFRAISGFGEHEHTAVLIDLSLDLPLTLEFFDEKSKVMAALDHLSQTLKPEHIVLWEAQTNA